MRGFSARLRVVKAEPLGELGDGVIFDRLGARAVRQLPDRGEKIAEVHRLMLSISKNRHSRYLTALAQE